ncbi:hypothetical protein [Crenothrix sp.]|uniref:hypothetical protein n=1 Tax=Crenothrix sp. TaxID=3100433 RepID=UPI00374D841B
MNKFSLNQQSSTFGSVIIMWGILACQLLPISENKTNSAREFKKENNISDNSNSTYSEYNSFTKSNFKYEIVNANFEQIISEFYSKFLINQEPLGEEFESILFNNLWDLYES